MDKAVLYIHGQGGNPDEANHYRPLFEDHDIIGLEYTAQTPWEAKEEFPVLFDLVCGKYKSVTVIANSIGAFFAMSSLDGKNIEKAYFISPVVDMQKLIEDMMSQAKVGLDELQEKGEIKTPFGQTLSWDYLSYVRKQQIDWKVPTHILYGSNDNLTSLETVSEFSGKIDATLTVMENGEHWFHTDEQMDFLDRWIKSF